jgi:hypothetical protein
MYKTSTSESEVMSVCDDQVAAGRLPPSAPLWGPPPPVPSRLPSVQPSDTGALWMLLLSGSDGLAPQRLDWHWLCLCHTRHQHAEHGVQMHFAVVAELLSSLQLCPSR